MPPMLVLFLCAIYVLLLLRLERKNAPNVSRALWIPTSWMLVIASKPLGIWFGSGGDGGSILDQVFLIALLVLALFILFSRKFSFSLALNENRVLMVAITYMFVSILWSDIPVDSIKRWIREVIAIVMAFLVRSEVDPRQAIQSILIRSIYILVPISLILIKYFPEYGVQYRKLGGQMWIGVTMQKNGLGRLCLISAFYLVWDLIRRWKDDELYVNKYQLWVDLSLLILTLFIMSGPGGQYSATALASLAAGISAFWFLLIIKKNGVVPSAKSLKTVLSIIFILGVIQPFLGGALVKSTAANFGRDVTLTGRTEIWNGLMPDVMEKPILGYGFASYWTPQTVMQHEIGEAHNGYLDVVLDTGFVGLIMLFLFILTSVTKAQQNLNEDFDWGCLSICFILMTLIHNFTESSLDSFTSQLPAIILLLTISSGNIAPTVSRNIDKIKTIPKFQKSRLRMIGKNKTL